MDMRSGLQIRLDALQRLIMINVLAPVLPITIVTEYPKSGGTWISQMLSDYLRVPFPRNVRPTLGANLMHTHLRYFPLMRNVVVVFRDGRDVMVSLYHHMLFENEKNSPLLVTGTRRDLAFADYEDVSANLPEFIQYVFERERRSVSPYHFTWPSFVRSWLDRRAISVRYEQMLASPGATLSAIVEQLSGEVAEPDRITEIVGRYSFENQSRRRPGQENKSSFLRKGESGDWINHFSRSASRLFDELAGDELEALGYEADSAWVQKQP